MPLLLGASLCSAGEYREPTGGEDFARMRVNWTPREEDRAIAARAWEMLSNSHRGLPRSERKLRVVYVTSS